MASDVVKGGWAPEEDEKLVQAIEKYGTRSVRASPFNRWMMNTHSADFRWSLVSAYVQTRNSDRKPYFTLSEQSLELMNRRMCQTLDRHSESHDRPYTMVCWSSKCFDNHDLMIPIKANIGCVASERCPRAWQTLDKDSADLFSGEDGTRRKESVGVLDLGISHFLLIFA